MSKKLRNTILRVIRQGSLHRLSKIVAIGLKLDLICETGLLNYGKINVIALRADNFDLDVDTVKENSLSLRIGYVRRSVVKNIFCAFVPPDITDNNYVSANPNIERMKEEYRFFLGKTWRNFDPKRKIKIVLTGNFGYAAERELSSALSSIGVKLIALHKENVKPPAYLRFWKNVYQQRRGKFTGHSICVYNEMEKKIIVDSLVASENDVVVTGMPRLDVLHRYRRSRTSRQIQQTVLYSLLTPETYMPILWDRSRNINDRAPSKAYISEADRNYEWRFLSEKCFQAMTDLALRSPSLRLIIKTKGNIHEREYVQNMISISTTFNKNNNIRLIHGGAAAPLIIHSDVICAFNSTIIFEGVAAGKFVIVPKFLEAVDPSYQDYQLELRRGVSFADDLNKLISLIEDFLQRAPVDGCDLSPDQAALLSTYLHNSDGSAGARVARYLESHLE